MEQTKGVTTRAYTIGKVFASDNATLNLKLDDKLSKKGDGLKVSEGAFQWLNKELGISVDNLNLRNSFYKTPNVNSRSNTNEKMLRASESYDNLQQNFISLTQPRNQQ